MPAPVNATYTTTVILCAGQSVYAGYENNNKGPSTLVVPGSAYITWTANSLSSVQVASIAVSSTDTNFGNISANVTFPFTALSTSMILFNTTYNNSSVPHDTNTVSTVSALVVTSGAAFAAGVTAGTITPAAATAWSSNLSVATTYGTALSADSWFGKWSSSTEQARRYVQDEF